MGVRTGDRAPDFELQDQNGKTVALRDFAGSKAVVLYFYPKDFTPGCSAETKTFSTVYDQLKELGAEVLGVSTGSVASHKDFAEECKAKFSLLADEGDRVRNLYGVPRSMWLIPGRVTYIIDKDGVVRQAYTSQTNTAGHVAEAIKTLKALK